MRTRGIYLGAVLMLCICFSAVLPVQAAGQGNQPGPMNGNAMNGNAMTGSIPGCLTDGTNMPGHAGNNGTCLQASQEGRGIAARSGARGNNAAAAGEQRSGAVNAGRNGDGQGNGLYQNREIMYTQAGIAAQNATQVQDRIQLRDATRLHSAGTAPGAAPVQDRKMTRLHVFNATQNT